MKIKQLVLKGYKRFDLLGSDKIVYTPESPYQLIVGKNGIGKSSLLGELSPLPCEGMDLKEDGYKKIEIEHRGHQYVLTNTMGKKLNNSFVRDGVELNEGGTIKAQKDLVWEHFHYDSNLHDVLIGNTLLTNMSPQQRREWFVKMSKSDIAYVISLYNKIRSEERDIKGALKLNNQRLISEKNKLPQADDIDRAKKEAEGYRNELNQLLPILDNNLQDTEEKLYRDTGTLKELSKRVIEFNSRLTLRVKDRDVKGKEAITQFITETQANYYHIQDSWKKAINELTELQDIVTKQKGLQERTVAMIDNDINVVKQKMDELGKRIQIADINVGENIEQQYQILTNTRDRIVETWVQMPSNPTLEDGSLTYTQSKYQTLLEEEKKITESQLKLTNKLDYYRSVLKGLEDVHDVDCPCCKHRFKPGVDRARIENGKKAIEELSVELECVNLSSEELMRKLRGYDRWIDVRRQLKGVLERYPAILPMFNYIHQHELVQANPYMVRELIVKYYEVLKLSREFSIETKTLNELIVERERRAAADGVDMEFIYQSITKLENDIAKYQQDSNTLKSLIDQAKVVLDNTNTIEGLVNDLSSLLTGYRLNAINLIKYRNNLKLSEIIRDRQMKLANSENFINRVNQSEGVIKRMEEANIELEDKQAALKVLTTLLSPQDGLIAESLIGFINKFLDNLVNVLEQIWSYPMRPYLDLGDEGIELDYRFPVEVNDGDIYVKDVSKLSRGQKEVTDFVFKLLLMQYLGLNDYPLIMDEVGGSFDDIHRDKLYRYVKLLVESNQLQQAFIISHIASSHDALSTADKIVLDTDTVMIDENVNKVISFE